MRVTYQANTYSPELVTGRYISRRYNGEYLVIEAGTCFSRGPFYGKLGQGPTLREYITHGEELPSSLKEELRINKPFHTIKWEM
ncbi:hypothetical protein ZPAH1_orf00141 [Aeromonas phage ZPAH1]|nr:hypothetical protein ASwh1_92 [Aeromonas phage Aswh_1]QQG33903.1 hypothetical protein ZPAH1_orf00141 [Aeromonas phage ZPAH1]